LIFNANETTIFPELSLKFAFCELFCSRKTVYSGIGILKTNQNFYCKSINYTTASKNNLLFLGSELLKPLILRSQTITAIGIAMASRKKKRK